MDKLMPSIEYFLPGWAVKWYQNRQHLKAVKEGYKTKTRHNTTRYYKNESPAEEVENSLDILRSSSRNLVKRSPIAESSISKNELCVIGKGLRLNVKVAHEFAGITTAEAETLSREIEMYWKVWCGQADLGRQWHFDILLALAVRTELVAGDVFFEVSKSGTADFATRINLIEGDRCASPHYKSDREGFSQGVEYKPTTGERTRYWFEQKRDYYTDWVGVPARFSDGQPRIIHHYHIMRPGQYRGLPYLSVVLEQLADLDEYSDAEIDSARVSAFFTAFVENSQGDLLGDVNPHVPPGESPGDTETAEFGTGNINYLGKGEKITFADPNRPNVNYGSFMQAAITQISAGLGMSPEVLLGRFDKSYSASRASIVYSYSYFDFRRSLVIKNVAEKLFQIIFREMLERKYVVLPKKLMAMSPGLLKQVISADFIGPGMTVIDPVKEISAAEKRMSNYITTHEEEAARYGVDWHRKIAAIKREKEIIESFAGDSNVVD